MPTHEERDAYLHDCAARFTADLESILKRDPLQWYNFYPFWEKAGEPARLPRRAAQTQPQLTELEQLNKLGEKTLLPTNK
jgi:hypothetical protein